MSPLRKILDSLKKEQAILEAQILRTPTGPRRNAFCDANIHLMEAIRKLKEAPDAP